MKKTILLLVAVMLTAVAGYAQESRQDISISASGAFAPEVHGNAIKKDTTTTLGLLLSYRYMLTPRSALELNYGYAQNTQKYVVSGKAQGGIHILQSEFSAGYVYSRNYGNFNPFAEVGVGAMMFRPLKDNGTYQIDAKQNLNIGGLFGAGLAYEISPSFDVRVEYRGFAVKTPDFGLPGDIFKTNRYQVISSPSLGIAYHF
ncbi:MAG: outer membrane beta-barrel protein [Edaphobacter sp.]